MRRSLIYFWRTHLAVVLGAAVATAVLTGALIVGDSVRGSLRDLTLSRLGDIDVAVLGDRPFGDDFGGRLDERLGRGVAPAPVLLVRGSALHADRRARASEVALLGIDETFSTLYPDHPAVDPAAAERGAFPPVILNRALADELGAEVGDPVLLSFERPAEIPRETLVGRQEAADTIRVLRLSVASIVADHGPGSFALTSHQTRPLNAYLELRRLQRALFGREESQRINVLLLREEPELPTEALAEAVRDVLRNDDIGVELRERDDHLAVLSREFVLRPSLSAALAAFAAEQGAPSQPVLTYLANSIATGDRSVPYSTITAVDPVDAEALGPFRLIDGSPAPRLTEDEILLDEWTAADLEAEPGAEIEVSYYLVGDRDELSVTSQSFVLRGVVAMEGLAVDADLTPEFPGIHAADDMSGWDPPFPVDLEVIRDRDEAYWDDYGAAPKAFVSEALGRRLWNSRFGDLTSVRLAPPDGTSLAAFRAAFEERLTEHVDLSTAGFTIRALREEGLRGARGATDFAGLFLALSMFLIAAAAMLVGLLFRLGIEQRAKEIGLLRSVGYRVRTVHRSFLGEGALLAIVGAILGLGLALAYAALMLAGLRTWWLPAVGTPVLFLHVVPATLVIGWTASVAVVLFSIWWALRRLHRIPAPALLAGSTAAVETATRPKRARAVAIVGALVALAIVVWTFAAGEVAAGPAFGIGACLLIAGLAWFSYRVGGGARQANSLGRAATVGMGVRNSGRNRGRSLLSAGLVASACFIIVVVAANRVGHDIDVENRDSGAGGFSLVAQSDVPLLTDLNRPEGRFDLGFSERSAELFESVDIYPLRLLPGEDVSCLNLFRPERPRVLGVPADLIERGGFAFAGTLDGPERANPWTLLEGELEPGVIPAFADQNSALWVLHLGLGDDIVLPSGQGGEVRLRLVGLLGRSLFQSEVLISEENFTRYFPGQAGYSVFLADPPLASADALGVELEATLEDFGFDVTRSDEKIASFLAVESTYMSTFQTLGGLGLILGTIGLGIVLLRNVLERRGELATLRAFGYRRSTLSWVVLIENAVLLVVGIAIGTVAGLVASTPNLVVAGTHLPWASLGATLVVVFAIGMLASVLAVASTLRVPLLPALKAD